MKMPDTTEVKIVWNLLEGLANLLKVLPTVASNLNIFLYGAKGTGKTSFARALSGRPVEDARGVSRTSCIIRDTISYRHNGFNLSIKCADSPGEKVARINSLAEISQKLPPHVTLLFLDH